MQTKKKKPIVHGRRKEVLNEVDSCSRVLSACEDLLSNPFGYAETKRRKREAKKTCVVVCIDPVCVQSS